MKLFRPILTCLLAGGLGSVAFGVQPGGADVRSMTNGTVIRLGVMKSGGTVLSNVVIYSCDGDTVFVRHSGGLVNLKTADLEPDVQRKLGLIGPEDPAPAGEHALVPRGMLSALPVLPDARLLLRLGGVFLAIVAAAALLGHVVVSYLLRRICIKAGEPPDVLIWVPLLQLVPLARAARMSPGSVLLVGAAAIAGPVLQGVSSPYALPANAAGLVVILLFWLTWCVKICQARKKSPLLAVPLALPGLNLLALLYLAGSE